MRELKNYATEDTHTLDKLRLNNLANKYRWFWGGVLYGVDFNRGSGLTAVNR